MSSFVAVISCDLISFANKRLKTSHHVVISLCNELTLVLMMSAPQALSLSCTTGQAVTRDVPFKNAGNIPVRVRMKTSSDTDNFTVTPDFLLMEPREVRRGPPCPFKKERSYL